MTTQGLQKKISADFKTALLAKKMEEVGALRLLQAAILSREKEKRYKVALKEKGLAEQELVKKSRLSDEELVDLIVSEAKKRKEAILLFEKGKRQDLVVKEQKELEILQRYLPEQLADDELKALVEQVVKETGAASVKDLGKVMAKLMPQVKGRVDGERVAALVKEGLIAR